MVFYANADRALHNAEKEGVWWAGVALHPIGLAMV